MFCWESVLNIKLLVRENQFKTLLNNLFVFEKNAASSTEELHEHSAGLQRL